MDTKDGEGEIIMIPNWLELPSEITTNIVQRLSVVEIVTSVSQVCTLWRKICKDPHMWRIIDMSGPRRFLWRQICQNPPIWRSVEMSTRHHSSYDLVKICRYVVKLSCGLLEDINIEYFGNDDLLEYIANSTRQLRRLGIANCKNISDEGVIKSANKFPLLEDLDISYSYQITNDAVEVIGQSCPLLNSLKYSRFCWSDVPNVPEDGVNEVDAVGDDMDLSEDELTTNDSEAFAIAKTMPQLRHLSIYENALSNKGLCAILDGCPLLESLDLRECYYLDWSGSLKERCIEQIRNLQPPF